MCVCVSVGFGASVTTTGVLPGTWTQRSVQAHLVKRVFWLQPHKKKTPNTDQRSLRFEFTSPNTACYHQPNVTAFKHVFVWTVQVFRVSPPHATSDRVHRADESVAPGESHRMQLRDISASLVKTRQTSRSHTDPRSVAVRGAMINPPRRLLAARQVSYL